MLSGLHILPVLQVITAQCSPDSSYSVCSGSSSSYSMFSKFFLLPVLQVPYAPCSPGFFYSVFSRFLLLRILQVPSTPCSPWELRDLHVPHPRCYSEFSYSSFLSNSSYFEFSGFLLLRVLQVTLTPCYSGSFYSVCSMIHLCCVL